MIFPFLTRLTPLPLLLAVMVGLGGCLAMPSRSFLAMPMTAEAVDPPPWWRSFRDPAIDDLVREALQGNADLRALAARMQQADARLRQAGARLFPSLRAEGDYQDRQINRLGGSDVAPDRSRASTIGMLLDWELDVWGRLRSAAQAASLEAAATRQDWLGARLLASAAVAETYLEILEQMQIRRLLDEQIAVNEQLRDLTELRFGQSLASIVDVLQQREQLEATLALVPPTEALLEEAEAGLAVLLGRVPGVNEPDFDARFPEASPLPEDGVSSLQVLERPDLQSIRLRMRAQDARVAEAMADLLPRFNVGASAAATGTPGIDALVTSLLAGALAPLFEGGARRAEVTLRQAEWEELARLFAQAYLEAVRDLEVAVINERKEAERTRLLENQLSTAQRLLAESRNRYANGLTSYLPVLDALQTLQLLERDLVASKRLRLTYRVAVHRAAGGAVEHP